MVGNLMPLRVKEIFYTIQGEGMNAGRSAVFIRFAGCNLWNGHEEDRATSICRFCDTDFIGGDWYPDAARLAMRARGLWPSVQRPFAVLTGGEPTLQPELAKLIVELKALRFDIAIETNGTRPAPEGAWITVSPKAGSEVVQRAGNELKVVWPQPFNLDDLRLWKFDHYLLQPKDGPDREANTKACVDRCLHNPEWRLSLQTHKYLGIR